MNLKQKAISGTIWTTSASIVRAAVQVLRLMVLTRFLLPADFGIVAIVIVITGFLQNFSDLGVAVALYSKNDVTIKQSSSLFWVTILLGICIYLLLIGATPFIADFYEMAELRTIIPIMGLDIILSGAARQFRVYKQKAFAFKSVAVIEISVTVASLILAWFLASAGYGVYSLVYSVLFASSLFSVLLIATSLKDYPIKWYINLKESKEIYVIGFYQLGSQMLEYFTTQLDVLIIGKIMPASDLGIYSLVKQLVMKVKDLFWQLISNVAMPVLASTKAVPEKFKQSYLNINSLIGLSSSLLFYGIAAFAQTVIVILYGAEYTSASLLLQLSCAWVILLTINDAINIGVFVQGKTKYAMYWSIYRIIATPLVIFAGSYIAGMNGIVIAQMLFLIISHPLFYTFIFTKILQQVSYWTYAKSTYFKPLVYGIILGGIIIIGYYVDINVYIKEFITAILFLVVFILLSFKPILLFILERKAQRKKLVD